MNSLVAFKGQIIFSLLCFAAFAFINQIGIQMTFPACHHIPKQYSPKLNGGHYTGFGFGGFFKGVQWEWEWEWYFTVWDTSNICGLWKISWASFASLGLNWQIWFYCHGDWLPLTTSFSYMLDQRTRIIELDRESMSLLEPTNMFIAVVSTILLLLLFKNLH